MKTIMKQTVLEELINDYVQCNYWANKTMIEWILTKPEKDIDKEIPSSFSSIIKTWQHIWQTQIFWLQAISRNTIKGKVLDENTTAEVFLEAVKTDSKAFVDYVSTLNDDELQEHIELKTPWFESNQPRYQLIQHCMNHSTYHRGQIVSIGRNLGYTDAPMTDFNFYLLMRK